MTFLAWHIYLHTFISSVDVLQWTLLCPFSGVKNTHRCVDRGHLDEKSPLCDAVFTSCFSCAVLAFILFTVLRTCPLKPQLSVGVAELALLFYALLWFGVGGWAFGTSDV